MMLTMPRFNPLLAKHDYLARHKWWQDNLAALKQSSHLLIELLADGSPFPGASLSPLLLPLGSPPLELSEQVLLAAPVVREDSSELFQPYVAQHSSIPTSHLSPVNCTSSRIEQLLQHWSRPRSQPCCTSIFLSRVLLLLRKDQLSRLKLAAEYVALCQQNIGGNWTVGVTLEELSMNQLSKSSIRTTCFRFKT